MANKIIQKGFGFATFPTVIMYDYVKNKKTGKIKFQKVKELLFGDYITPKIKNGDFDSEIIDNNTYIKVHSRDRDGYILPSKIQEERIVEVNFIDVGQGDSCHIVTEDDTHFIVDAGASNNMFRFIKWRFNLEESKNTPPKFTGIVTHSDKDHYYGFNNLFKTYPNLKQQIVFNEILHNGLVEMSGSSLATLGTVINTPAGSFITDLCDDNQKFINLSQGVKPTGQYISTILKTTAPKKSVKSGDKLHSGSLSTIDVIGPIREVVGGKEALPIFEDNKGKTKNGNSVILMITVGKLKILLGGDLNSAEEDYLLKQVTKIDVPGIRIQLENKDLDEVKRKNLVDQLETAIKKAGLYFGADIAKSCHHGSDDVTTEFLRAVNPLATIISSGDEEGYCHPRPDTLGLVGKTSRGERPLIYCTELARSTKEFVTVTQSSRPKDRIKAVTVYGMICVRADKDKALIAMKLEDGSGWFVKKIHFDKTLKQFAVIG
jgi:beta-lactamase superfamily II metal-dependent hydrolase